MLDEMVFDVPMRVVFYHALTSKDPSTQNAAVLIKPGAFHYEVIRPTLAVNEFPRRVIQHPDRWKRPEKYQFVEHAERNSIYAAAREGISTRGLTMVAVWASCADCARAIIQAGITTLVRYAHTESHWDGSTNVADMMLAEAGVRVVTITKEFRDVEPLLWHERPWLPDGSQS